MPYTATITRTSPTCLVLLVDQSKSMNGPFGGQPGKSKAEGVADAINHFLQNLVLKCAKAEGVRDYFHVAVIGYGGAEAGSALAGSLADKLLVPISALAYHPLRVDRRVRSADDGAGGLVEQEFKLPVWVEPEAHGKTPMCAALKMAARAVRRFLEQSPDCFPPLVLHLTDGDASDGDPVPVADDLRQLNSTDGRVLLFNSHLSSSPAPALVFPEDDAGLPDDFARQLFRMSSRLPHPFQDAAQASGLTVKPHSRGFVFNADLVSVIRFLDIGTRVASNLR